MVTVPQHSAPSDAACYQPCEQGPRSVAQGGYDLKGLADGVRDSFRGVLGLPSSDRYNPALLRDEPTDKVAAALAEVRTVHGL